MSSYLDISQKLNTQKACCSRRSCFGTNGPGYSHHSLTAVSFVCNRCLGGNLFGPRASHDLHVRLVNLPTLPKSPQLSSVPGFFGTAQSTNVIILLPEPEHVSESICITKITVCSIYSLYVHMLMKQSEEINTVAAFYKCVLEM